MLDDIDRIMRIMECAFDPLWGEAWNRRQITDSLSMPNTHYRLAEPVGNDNGEASNSAGFTLVRSAPGEEELLLIAVDPACRGRGIGRRLIEAIIADARTRNAERMFLEMRADNPAETLYRKAGFLPIGRRPDYYRRADGVRVDAITFGLAL